MQRYGNRAGDSGVVAFRLYDDAIAVQFRNGDIYLYDEFRPGELDVQQMQQAARVGSGLSTYISQNVRERFARKLTLQQVSERRGQSGGRPKRAPVAATSTRLSRAADPSKPQPSAAGHAAEKRDGK